MHEPNSTLAEMTTAGPLPRPSLTSVPSTAPRVNRIFIDANAQLDNFGDDIIVRQELRMLARRGQLSVDVRKMPRWAIEVVDVDPRTAQARAGFGGRILFHGLRSRLRPNGERVFLVLKPGHINGRYTARRVLARIGLLGLTALCRLIGVGVVRMGFSVDDLKPPMLHIEKVQSRLHTVYAPRDELTQQYCESVGIRTTGRSTDFAYTLGVTDAPARLRSGLVMCFAATTDGHLQSGYADALETFLRSYLAAEGTSDQQVSWCVQVTRDLSFRDHVLKGFPHVSGPVFTDLASGQEILALYQRTDVVVTNRLHSFLLALSQGAMAVVVTDPGTHSKIVGLVDEMGVPELLVPLHGLTVDSFNAHLTALRDDRERIMRVVAAYFDDQTDRQNALMDQWLGSPIASVDERPNDRLASSRHYSPVAR